MKTTDQYLFFWSGIFSNWYMSPFTIKDVTYSCVEQYMMAQKALLFEDEYTAGLIMQATHPRDIKQLGRCAKGFNAELWDEWKLKIVTRGCLEKFRQDEELKQQLLNTGDRTLVEASPYDKIWGIGMAEDDPNILNESAWRGQNLLGKALMLAREELRNQGGV